MVKIQSGKTQLIRVVIENKENISLAENAYKIYVQELPDTVKVDNIATSKVELVIGFNVPITISG